MGWPDSTLQILYHNERLNFLNFEKKNTFLIKNKEEKSREKSIHSIVVFNIEKQSKYKNERKKENVP